MRRGRGYNWQGRYSRQGAAAPGLPDALAGAGAFASGTGWTLNDYGGGAPVIAGGVLTSSGAGEAAYTTASPIAAGMPWAAVVVVDSVGSGDITIGWSASAPRLITAPGTYTIYGAASSGGSLFYINFTGTAVVSDVKLYDISSITPGANIFPEGDFASSSGFTVTGTGASITGGKFQVTSAVGLRRALRTSGTTLVRGDLFYVTWTNSSRTAGSSTPYVGGNTVTGAAADGTFSAYIATGASTQTIGAQVNSNSALHVDDVIIQPVTYP